MNHSFCRLYLAQVRAAQRKAGLELPGLCCWHSHGCGPNHWWEVRSCLTGRLFWQGAAHCAYDARAKTISAELHKLEQGELL